MALHGDGKSAGKTGGGWSETEAVEADIFGAGIDMKNAVNRCLFDQNIRRRRPGVSPDFGAGLASFAAMLDVSGIAARNGCGGQMIAGPIRQTRHSGQGECVENGGPSGSGNMQTRPQTCPTGPDGGNFLICWRRCCRTTMHRGSSEPTKSNQDIPPGLPFLEFGVGAMALLPLF